MNGVQLQVSETLLNLWVIQGQSGVMGSNGSKKKSNMSTHQFNSVKVSEPCSKLECKNFTDTTIQFVATLLYI